MPSQQILDSSLERHFAQLEALYRMTAAVSRSIPLERIYEEALEALITAVGADRASVLLFDADDVMRFKASRGLSQEYREAVEGHSPWTRDAADPQAFGVSDVAQEMEPGELRDTILREGIRACAFIPLVSASGLLGKFMVYYNEPHAFLQEELRLAQTIAKQISLSILRVRAEEAVRVRERAYRTLADNMPQIVARFDTDLVYTYINPAVRNATGLDPEKFLGKPSSEMSVAPEVGSLWQKRLKRCFETRSPVHFEFTFPSPNGIRNFSTDLVPEFDEAGEMVSVMSITTDITERVQQEERQRFLAEISTRLVESLDYESTLLELANLMTETIADGCSIEISNADGSLRRICLQSRVPENIKQIEQLHSHAEHCLRLPLNARGRTLGFITLVSTSDEHRFDAGVRDFAEEIAKRAALVIDNARLYQEAHDASMAKSAFLATMSHELRTPLNAILGYAELMELGVAGSVTEQQSQQLERISASAWHLLTVIEEILTFSRVEAGREEVHLENFGVADIVQEAVSMVEGAAQRKGLELKVELPEAGVTIHSDRGKVRQILLNLLSNAVKFTETGSIECAARMQDKVVFMQVRDTGTGIAPEHRERVFEPFWQAGQGATRKAGGTGLGLTVSRQLAQLLGGDVALESTMGEGSTFTVTLPSL